MIELRAYASEIAKEAGGVLEGKDCYIEYLSLDTREDIKKPFCFVAICGKNFDGHSFIECALEKGAELIISEKKVNTDKAVIYVESTVKALGMIAKSRKKGIKVVGVTGSTGKTTTKDMILSVLGSKFNACGTRENQNNELGVALTLLQAEENSICVIEMGARKKGDISYLAQICDPFVSVVTNCGSAHIEYFKTKKAIFDEKIKIITKNTKYAIIPCEKRFKKKIPKDATPIFIGEQKNYRFKNIKLGENGLVGDLCLNDKVVTNIESNIFSKKVFENFLYAIYVGEIFGMTVEEIKKGIIAYKGTKGRKEITEIKETVIIDDTYNASYESTIASINMLKEYKVAFNKKAIFVFGDMLELGKCSKKYHTNVGKKCKKAGINGVYVMGLYGKYVLKGNKKAKNFKAREEIINELIKENLTDTVILIKASRKMGFEKIVEVLKDKLNE